MTFPFRILAVKLHLLLDHDGHLPSYAVITPGKVHEIRIARQMKLPRGTMVVFDRGFSDYAWQFLCLGS